MPAGAPSAPTTRRASATALVRLGGSPRPNHALGQVGNPHPDSASTIHQSRSERSGCQLDSNHEVASSRTCVSSTSTSDTRRSMSCSSRLGPWISTGYRTTPSRATTSSSSEPASPGCTCCTALRASSGSTPSCSKPATASAAPGTGTATRARAATSRASTTPTRSPTELEQEWEWTERYAAQPEILALPRPRRRPLRPAPRHPVRDAGRGGALRRSDRRAGRSQHRQPARRVTAQFLHHGRPAACRPRNVPTSPGLDEFEGEWYHTGRWPHDGVDFTRQAGRRDRHRLDRHPGDPGDRRGRRTHLTVFQRTPNYSVPAQQRARSTRAESRRRSRPTTPGSPARAAVAVRSRLPVRPSRTLGAARSRDEERRARATRSAGSSGGFAFLSARFNDLLTDDEANDTAAEFIRDKIREIVKDPEPSPRLLVPDDHPYRHASARASTPTTSRPSTATTSRWSTCSATPIEEITPTASAPRTAEYELDVIVFATGFDAMTGRAARDRHPRPRRPVAARSVGATGPRTYLGLRRRRLPEPVHDHRPGQPVGADATCSCRSSSTSTGSPTASSTCARQRARRASRPTPTAEDAWVEHVNEVADVTLFPQGQLLVHGRQHPRQAAGVHALRRRRRRSTGSAATRSPTTGTRASPSRHEGAAGNQPARILSDSFVRKHLPPNSFFWGLVR